MVISEVSNMAVILLVAFLSLVVDIRHVSSDGSWQTTNWEGHAITKGLAPMHGRSEMTVRKAARSHITMAQAASDVEHVITNEAGEDETKSENKGRTSNGGAFDEAKMTYENAKKRVGEAYKTAKESMTESAKREYEDAKEKASKAAGDLGAKMRAGEEEL
ncbi:hypothetical protein FCM35_KLT15770 [Carex littledalei]|uniref:Uncharacterized protein n=1 Tax=Carex littledalei TaxID=544730 RepID=A0A833REU8_9POAL|nr:hypothetical protein FCM35_KLT15770 [Carex littledalei]